MLETPQAQILNYRKFSRDGHLYFFYLSVVSRTIRKNILDDKTESDYPKWSKVPLPYPASQQPQSFYSK